MSTRQDNKYEKQQCTKYGLKHIDRRGNSYIPDCLYSNSMILSSNGKVLRGELKACQLPKNSFSSSSRMGIDKIVQWKMGWDFAIFSIFDENDNNVHDYFATHESLKPFYDQVEKKQREGHAGRSGLDDWVIARKDLETIGWCKKTLNKMEKTNKFGSRLNDPQIALSDIRDKCFEIDQKNPIQHLKQLVEQHCSNLGLDITQIDSTDSKTFPKGFSKGSGKNKTLCPTLHETIKEVKEVMAEALLLEAS